MPSLLLACALAVASLVACSGAAPATATGPTAAAAPQGNQPLCDAACWRQLNNFLAETCRCTTESCAERTRERMISWVTTEVVEARHLSDRQQEVDLPLELEPYDAVDDACTARLRPPPSPTRRRPFVEGRVAISAARAARAIRASSR